MPKVFICYRREDSAYPAHQIYNELTDHFGSESVVFDVDAIPLGTDFREYLNNQISECDVLLAIVGDQWIEILKQRLGDPNDFVRIEIQAALEREIPVVPILVGNALVPSEENLPPELNGFPYKHATEVRAGADLQAQIKRMINGLDRLLAKREERQPITDPIAQRKKRLVFGIGAVALMLALSVIGLFLFSKYPNRSPSPIGDIANSENTPEPAPTEQNRSQVIEAEIRDLIDNLPQLTVLPNWREQEHNSDIMYECSAKLTSSGYSVNHVGAEDFNITRRFNAVGHCNPSKHPQGVPECNCNGSISATATIKAQYNGLLSVNSVKANISGCKCLEGRGLAHVENTVKLFNDQYINLSALNAMN